MQLPVLNPYNGELLETLPLLRDSDLTGVLDRATRLYRERRLHLPLHERVMVLEALLGLMAEHRDELVNLALQEGGKPRADTEVEMTRALDGVKVALAEMRLGEGREVTMGYTKATAGRIAFTRREPIGVVAAFSAFNHPINLWVHQVVPAVAVGAPVIYKPAPDTPLTGIRLTQLLYQAGLPQQWCQAITLPNELAALLAQSPQLAHLNFIGSAQVGWQIRRSLAPGTRLALEHGGAAPVIIDETADLTHALKLLVPGAFYHAGQVCVSVQRIYVHHSIAESFAQQLAEAASALVVGNPDEATTQVGPLIRPEAVQRIDDWVEEAVKHGAGLLCGGFPLPEHRSYAPTVLYNAPIDSQVMTEEIFGPVVCVTPYQKLDEAITLANRLRTHFQAAIFTQKLNDALLACQALDAATVLVNDSTTFRADWMPFAGHGDSGLGTGGIGPTMHEYSREKLWVLRTI